MNVSKRLAQGLFALAIVVASMAMTPKAAALNPNYTSVALFKWRWTDIGTECTNWLGPQGYGAVQISPPSAGYNNGYWYGIYQPVNYTSLTSELGNASQLQTMINACHAAGVRVYADIVVNQMAGGSGTATDGSTWNANSSTAIQYPYFSTADFHTDCSITSADYAGTTPAGADGSTALAQSTWDVQNCWLSGLPDLATDHTYVQGQIENYLELLLSMGVDGFRWDAAKHQQEADLAIILAAARAKYPKTTEGESFFVTQEIIPDGEVNRPSYEPLGTLNEFQFTYAMQDTFRNLYGYTPSNLQTIMGTPGNWGGSWYFLPSASAEIFVDDWDTERPSGGGSLTASDFTGDTNDEWDTHRYDLANIFMLAQAYGAVAQVQSGFRFTNSSQNMPSANAYINGVAQVPASKTTPTSGWDFIHRWADISNMVKFRTATWGQGMSNWVTGTTNQIAFSRGAVGFVALNNDTTVWSKTFTTGLPAGTYCNVVNGVKSGSTCTADTVTVNSSGQATLSIPANGGTAIPAVAIYTGEKE